MSASGRAVLCALLCAACGGSSAPPANPSQGCASSAACGPGTACNLTTGVCEAICDTDHDTCNGCCAGTACVAGTSNDACGASGGACTSCYPCVAVAGGGTCGCGSSGQCAAGQACSNVTHLCDSVCDADHDRCNGCCAGNACVAGTASAACGYGGYACANCAGASTNQYCVSTGGGRRCGCSSVQHCGPGQACNYRTAYCGTDCYGDGGNGSSSCNGGCCNDPTYPSGSGTCAPGTAHDACGAGALCTACNALMQCRPAAGGGTCGY